LKRENLKPFTKISFYLALATIIVIPISILTSTITLNENSKSIIKMIALLTFYISVFGIPLSIISMFSKEKLAKRIFSLVVNLSPISIIIYAFIMEFIDEFPQFAP